MYCADYPNIEDSKKETKLTKSLKDKGKKKSLYTITDENISINICLIA